MECRVRSHQGTWWSTDATASCLPADSFWSQGMLGTQGAKRGMGIRVRTGFVVVSFPSNIYRFPFLIHSASTIWLLYAWHFTGHLGFEDEYRRIPPLKKSDIIWNPDQRYPLGGAVLKEGCAAPCFCNLMSLISKHFPFHSILLF